ncbi:MAG: hypothetical protein JXR72_08410 [Proteobacteria bacterium]|nr:hypothetical protein [Pseudomonadota bacterium]
MTSAREIVDVYIGSEEVEKFDMWFSYRELRNQFDAADHIGRAGIRKSPAAPGKTRQKSGSGILRKLAINPWPLHV